MTSVAPDDDLGDQIELEARARGLDLTGWEFISARSETALPRLLGRTFDVSLMNGGRGWSTVFVDFCYLNAALRQGGLLLVSDAQLHSVRELVDLLRSQPGFRVVRDVTRLRAFRKESDARFPPDFGGQPYLGASPEEWSQGPRAPRFTPPPSWAESREHRERALADAADSIAAGDLPRARASLEILSTLDVTDSVLTETDGWLRAFAGDRRIVATTDPGRTPTDDEVVVIYGNYPLGFDNIVSNNPIKRHVTDFWSLPHDSVESDPGWSAVDRIYIINLDERTDRYEATLRELARARAPLDRVERASAAPPDPNDDEAMRGHVACLRSHLQVVERIAKASRPNALVIEDDFSFTSDVDTHIADLAAFLDRDYDYWVCLVATHNEGPVVALDDLVAESHQQVTTTAGYLLSAEGAERLMSVYSDALPRLIATGEEVYVADRCWAVLQEPGRFLVFRRKFGFQAAAVSDITGEVTRYRF